MIDYSKGKIYTIRSHQTDKIYIGSTTQSLKERLRGHKKVYNSWKNGRGSNYVSSYEILKYDDAYIELLEDCDCERKEQLHKREGELIREMDCVNKFIPGRSKKEYRNDNKEKIAEQMRLYRNNNKDRIVEYREKNKEKITEDAKLYYQKNKEKLLKQESLYREKNKEKIAERKRVYNQKNKERLKLHNGKRYNCECGGKYTHSQKSIHLRTKKHQEYLKSLNKT